MKDRPGAAGLRQFFASAAKWIYVYLFHWKFHGDVLE